MILQSRMVLGTLVGLCISACATTIVPQATGGSRADGTVTMSYEFGWLQDPEVQWGPAQNIARSRCGAWGYTDAQAFGGGQATCISYDGYGGCNRTRVDMVYQCTGADTPDIIQTPVTNQSQATPQRTNLQSLTPQPETSGPTNLQQGVNLGVSKCLAEGSEVIRVATNTCSSGLTCIDTSVHAVGVSTCIN
jgi:hypothetical protein